MSEALEREVLAAWYVEPGTINERRTDWLDIASDAAIERIHQAMLRPGALTPAGIPSIDRNLFLWGDRKGIPQGTYVLIGGSSNAGKTLLGLHLLRKAAESHQRAGLISLDMKHRDALARMHQGLSQMVPSSQWRPSRWTDANRQHLAGDVRSWSEKLRLDEDDRGGGIAIHLECSRDIDAVAACISEGRDAGATFFVVDHLQKIRVQRLRGDVFASADYVSETLDDLVDQLNVTIVGLSQLNRQASRETDRKPTMYDLHGGTSMESNAGLVIMIDHSRYATDPQRYNLVRTFLILAKNQMGPKNIELPVVVDTAQLSVLEGLPSEEHLWPGNGKKRR